MNRIVDFKVALFLPLLIFLHIADSAILDPALYLYPSPPISDTEGKEIWTRSSRSTKLQNYGGYTAEPRETTAVVTATEQESMENAETFWPRLRSIDYAIKQVHVPVTFSISGNYGGYRGAAGVIGNSYASIGGSSLFGYGKSAFAGSGYGNYGSPVRMYGGQDGPAWSGWGNGKWGHYGKG